MAESKENSDLKAILKKLEISNKNIETIFKELKRLGKDENTLVNELLESRDKLEYTINKLKLPKMLKMRLRTSILKMYKNIKGEQEKKNKENNKVYLTTLNNLLKYASREELSKIVELNDYISDLSETKNQLEKKEKEMETVYTKISEIMKIKIWEQFQEKNKILAARLENLEIYIKNLEKGRDECCQKLMKKKFNQEERKKEILEIVKDKLVNKNIFGELKETSKNYHLCNLFQILQDITKNNQELVRNTISISSKQEEKQEEKEEKLSLKEKEKKKIIFKYKSDFDKNGFMFYLGKNKKNEWENPMDQFLVGVEGSGIEKGSYSAFLSRVSNKLLNCTKNGEPSFIIINFGNFLLCPTKYTWRHDYSDSFMRNWKILGYHNDEWKELVKHENCKIFKKKNQVHSWRINTNYFISKIKIVITGPNSNGDVKLCGNGFEVYGAIIKNNFKLKA